MLMFFINDTATTENYTLCRHDALPISRKNNTWPRPPTYAKSPWHAGMAELVDAGDSKSPAARRGGSIPSTRTTAPPTGAGRRRTARRIRAESPFRSRMSAIPSL